MINNVSLILCLLLQTLNATMLVLLFDSDRTPKKHLSIFICSVMIQDFATQAATLPYDYIGYTFEFPSTFMKPSLQYVNDIDTLLIFVFHSC